MTDILLTACPVVSGAAEGPALVSSQPISFWGGVDPHTGRIHDPKHELFGQSVSGQILVFPYGKGSSTGSLMMLELVRIHKAPAAIINIRTEPILATGPIVSRYFYGRSIPILTLAPEDFCQIRTGQHLVVNASDGFVCIRDIP
ncbi:MAG: DUF126 domain-containing protein [Desulfatirhabdiaceae bacterium]